MGATDAQRYMNPTIAMAIQESFVPFSALFSGLTALGRL